MLNLRFAAFVGCVVLAAVIFAVRFSGSAQTTGNAQINLTYVTGEHVNAEITAT